MSVDLKPRNADAAVTFGWSLPRRRDLFYGGQWRRPNGGYGRTVNPATQEDLGEVALADAADVDAAVQAAHAAFASWRHTLPIERANLMKALAARIRAAADELGWLDSTNCGNPIGEMTRDAQSAATQMDYFAGVAHELKGETLPVGDGRLNYSVREPLGVVARLVAYNHPLMFLASKLAPVVMAGNTVVMKAPDQAPLSAYRLAELVADIFPPGVINIVTGGKACGEALVTHPIVRKVALIGSIPTGIAILKATAEKIIPVTLELGGKNPLIICPDADIDKAIKGAVAGMNFTWAGQSCGSTSRCFAHSSVYDEVVAGVQARVAAQHRCGLPTDPATTMGCLISEQQFDKVMAMIADAREDGARLILGGRRSDDPALANGWFIEPTIFADVTPEMRVFQQEAFGPILSIIRWDEEAALIEQINGLEFGLTASIWTRDLAVAHRLASRVEAGFVWINFTGAHFLGTDFGGYKKSGLGREEGLTELLAYTQSKNVHVVMN